jgi:hypothetical protein
MTRSAMMALEQVREQEVVKEPVPVQEFREKTQKLPLALAYPADPPVTASIGNLERISLVESSTTSSSPASSIPMTKHKIRTAKTNFVGKMLEASEQMETQRERLVDESRNLDGQWHGKVLNRIRQAEVEVEREEYQIQHMIQSPNLELSMAMRAIAALNEKKAYLKGLKFQLQETRG